MQPESQHQSPNPRKRHTTKRAGIYFREGADSKRRYSVHYRDSAGKSRSKTIEGGMREAEAVLDNLRDRMRKGERVLPSKVTFGDFAETWLDGQTQLRPASRANYRWALDTHLLPRFEHRKLSTLTEDDATELIAAMRKPTRERPNGYSGATIQAVLHPLSRILSHAARRGLVPVNPLDRLERGERPRKARTEMRCLDRDEISALLDAEPDPGMRTLLALSVSTGLRQGEALGLRWRDLDLAAGRLHVRFQLGRADGKLAEPKTEQARREVDLAPSLVAMLREHKLRSLHSGPSDFVFASAAGSPLRHHGLGRRLTAATKRAKLNEDGKTKLRWHDLRHTAASLLVAEGLNVVYVSKMLGHSSPKITLDVYSHLFDREQHAERARSAMDTALGNKWATSDGKQGENDTPAEPGEVAQLRGIGIPRN